METIKKGILLFAIVVFLSACGDGNEGGEETPPSEPAGSVAGGFAAMESANFDAALSEFCGVLETDPTNTQAAFGCAILQYVQIAEASEIQNALTGVGEDVVDIQDDIFSASGMLSIFIPIVEENSDILSLSLELFPMVPFTSRLNEQRGNRYRVFLESVVVDMNEQSFSVSDLQDNIFSQTDLLEAILDNILVAQADTNFSFTVPGAFIYSEDDWTVRFADLLTFEAGVRGHIYSEAFATKYDPLVVDTATLLDGDGTFLIDVVAAQLNGSLGTPFGSLKPGVENLSDLEPLASVLLSSSIEAIDALLIDGASDVLDVRRIPSGRRDLEEVRTLLSELQRSLTEGMTPLTMGALPLRWRGGDEDFQLSVDLGRFFSETPNARTMPVSAGNPFDYNAAGSPFPWSGEGLSFVESYFEAYFDGIIEWE